MTDKLSWLWTSFWDLPWWAMILWVVYMIYFIVRACAIWDATSKELWKGYRAVFFEYDKVVRLHHIVRIVFDIPPAALGLLFPVLRKILTLKIYEFKEEKK